MNIEILKKLINEEIESMIEEDLIQEGNAIGTMFRKALKAIDSEEEKLKKAEELIELMAQAVKTKDFSKLLPRVWQKADDTKKAEVIKQIETYMKGAANKKVLKIKAALSAAESTEEKVEILSTATAEEASKTGKSTEEAAKDTLRAIDPNAATPQNIKTIAAAADTDGAASPSPTTADTENPTIKAIAALNLKDEQEKAVAGFVMWLKSKNLLKEEPASLGALIEEYLKTIDNEATRDALKTALEEAIKNDEVKNILLAALGGPPDSGSDERSEVVDPPKELMDQLREQIIDFRDKFYCKGLNKAKNELERREMIQTCKENGVALSKAKQHEKIRALIKTIDDIIRIEKEEAGFDAPEEEIVAEEINSTNLRAYQADLESFLEEVDAAETIFRQAQNETGQRGQYFVKKATERTRDLIELAGELYDSLGELAKGRSPKSRRPPETVSEEAVLKEGAKEVNLVYKFVTVDLLAVLGELPEKRLMKDLMPKIEEASKQLKSTLKFFPKGKVFGKGTASADEALTKYKDAISHFGSRFIILRNLGQKLEAGGGSVAVKTVARQVRRFAQELSDSFGVPMPPEFNTKVETGTEEPEERTDTETAETEAEVPSSVPEDVVGELRAEMRRKAKEAIEQAKREKPDANAAEIVDRALEIQKEKRLDDATIETLNPEDIRAIKSNEDAEQWVERTLQDNIKEQEKELEALAGEKETAGANRFAAEIDGWGLDEKGTKIINRLLGSLLSGGAINEAASDNMEKDLGDIISKQIEAQLAGKKFSDEDRQWWEKWITDDNNYNKFKDLIQKASKEAIPLEGDRKKVSGVSALKTVFSTGRASYEKIQTISGLENLSEDAYDAFVRFFIYLKATEPKKKVNESPRKTGSLINTSIKTKNFGEQKLTDLYPPKKIKQVLVLFQRKGPGTYQEIEKLATDSKMFQKLIYQFTLATKNMNFILPQKKISALLKSNFATGDEDSKERGGLESFKEIGKILKSGMKDENDYERLANWVNQNKKMLIYNGSLGKNKIESAESGKSMDGYNFLKLILDDDEPKKFSFGEYSSQIKEFGKRILWNGKPLLGFFKRLFMKENQTAEQQIAESLKPLIEKILRGE